MHKPAVCTVLVTLAIFIVVICLHSTYSEYHNYKYDDYKMLSEYKGVMSIFVALYIAYFIQAVVEHFNSPTPGVIFIIVISFAWGIICCNNAGAQHASRGLKYHSREYLSIYVPVLAFRMAFCLDVPIFLKTLPQIAIIGVFVSLPSAFVFGMLALYVIDIKWPNEIGLLFGICCMPLYPHIITKILKQQSMLTKQISLLLEGDALIVFFITDVLFKLQVGYLSKFVVQWHQFVAVLARILILGLLDGIIFGLLSRYLIRKMYTYRLGVYIICFGTPFLAYSVSNQYSSGAGSICVVVVGLILGMERTVLPKDINIFLTEFWHIFLHILNIITCIKISVYNATEITLEKSWHKYFIILAVYFLHFMMRLVFFLLASPVISRLGYGMNLKNMIVCVWGGIQSPFSLEIVEVFFEFGLDRKIAKKFYFQVLGIYFLSVLINGSFLTAILDLLGLTQISLARQVNMNNCMKHIFTRRERTKAILKMDRLIADVNWAVLDEATNMKHPYQIGLETTENDELILGYRFTYCQECQREIPQEPTPKELQEMLKEAKMRILKAKKMSYSRQYENGMMSKEGIKVLTQAVEFAMDSENAEIKIEQLEKKFMKENWFTRFIRRQTEKISQNRKSNLKRPRTYWRRVCYHWVVTGRTFDIVMIIITIIYLSVIITEVYFHPISIFSSFEPVYNHKLYIDYIILGVKILFLLIYIFEMIIKILAFSWIHICSHGIRTYMKSLLNCIDFFVIIVCIVDLTIASVDLNRGFHTAAGNSYHKNIIHALLALRFVRLIRIFEIFYADIVLCLDEKADKRMAFTFELAKSFAKADAEILDMLPYMLDNIKVREEIKRNIEEERLLIVKLVGKVQKERSWIAITVKTIQSIRTILNTMRENINQLKSSGWVDTYEYEKLTSSMDELYKKTNSISKVDPSPPKVIFKEVPWMVDNEIITNFLFENVKVRKFDPGEVVFGQGTIADGIYIVVTGLFIISYKPSRELINQLHEYGLLPVVDYLTGGKFDEESVDYIVSGNCMGELSTLTSRKYDCVISADTYSQVYVLPNRVIRKAMELNPDRITGLECRIWKEIGIRVALPVLLSVPAYQSLSVDQIKYILERSFVPDLSKYKSFAITEMIEDIILIEGVVSDFDSRKIYIAPSYIPRTIRKLLLPLGSWIYIPMKFDTKLLIIPVKDVDEYEVILSCQEDCEIIHTGSSLQCLQHSAQERIRKKRQRFQRRGPRNSGTTSFVSKTSSMSSKELAKKQRLSVSSQASSTQQRRSIPQSLKSFNQFT